MRSLMASLLLALALGACASAPKTRTYTGVYVTGLAVESFYRDERPDPYWVTAEHDAHEALRALIPDTLAPGQGARVAVVIEGDRSRRGEYGPLGAYKREILIRRVVSARLVDPAPESGAASPAPAPERAPRRHWWWPWGR